LETTIQQQIQQQQQTEETKKVLESIKKDISEILKELEKWEVKDVKEKVDELRDITFDIEHYIYRNSSYFSLIPVGYIDEIRRIEIKGESGKLNEYSYEGQRVHEIIKRFFEDPTTAQRLIAKATKTVVNSTKVLLQIYSECLRMKEKFEELKEIVKDIEERIDC